MCEVMEKICKLCVLMVIFIFCGILTTNAQSQNEYTFRVGEDLRIDARILFKIDPPETAVYGVTKDGKNIPLNGGVLYIPNLQFSDTGIYIFTATTPTKVLYYHIRVIVESSDRGLYSSFGNLVPHLKKLIDSRLF